jgi:hypothetical protein
MVMALVLLILSVVAVFWAAVTQSPFALLIAAVLLVGAGVVEAVTRVHSAVRALHATGERTACPFCSESMLLTAAVCPHCQRDMPERVLSSRRGV